MILHLSFTVSTYVKKLNFQICYVCLTKHQVEEKTNKYQIHSNEKFKALPSAAAAAAVAASCKTP